jgi:hypothetical protein
VAEGVVLQADINHLTLDAVAAGVEQTSLSALPQQDLITLGLARLNKLMALRNAE